MILNKLSPKAGFIPAAPREISMPGTVYEKFCETAAAFPDCPAVVENEQVLTFRQLQERTEEIAARLDPSIRVFGIVMHHGIDMIAAMLAVLSRNACYVPAEPDFPEGRIRFMMSEAEAGLILCDEKTEALFAKNAVTITSLLEHAPYTQSNLNFSTDPFKMPAYILYTSGTTGKPKGVCVSQGNLLHYVRAFEKEFHPGPGDVMLQYSVCSFDIFVEEVFTSLLNGAALAIPNARQRKDLSLLMEFINRHQVTLLSGFPYLLEQMNHLDSIPESLRLLISGGDVLRESYITNLRGQAQIYNTYGPSETTVCASYYDCSKADALEDGTYPIGHPVDGTEIRIMDEEGREVPNGQTGEICIFGEGVSMGYIGDRHEENKAFTTHPVYGRMYRSGDVGYVLPDGNFAFCGRQDCQIMILGKRVELAEVESRLNQCSHVEQAVVRSFTDEQGLAYMIGYIVPSDDDLKVSEVRQELAVNLTPFMIPEFIIRLSSIPLNSHGKPDLSRLPVVLKEGALK